MKKPIPWLFVHWLLGDRAGYVLTATWNWLWGMPINAGGKVAVEVAQESLHSMQAAVQQLAESVASVTASYQTAKAKYDSKQQEWQQAEQQAALAYRNGNEAAAKLAMGKAITLERLLPQLAEQVARAEKLLQTHQEKLAREHQCLETYKVELQNLRDLSEVNEALAAIAKVSSDLGIDSARSQFEAAQSAVQGRYLKTNAIAELVEDPAEKLNAQLDQLTLDDAIAQRLKRLNEQFAEDDRGSKSE